MTHYIYILYLENNNWYVGASYKPDKRIKRHFAGRGAKWTQKHPPKAIAMIKKIKGSRKRAERITTLQLMDKFGILNVRGGAWCQRFLKDRQISCIKKHLKKLSEPTKEEKMAAEIGCLTNFEISN